ncbi:MAG: endonuclease/exonuclease/phosphatase family protein [Mycetocola sp.]
MTTTPQQKTGMWLMWAFIVLCVVMVGLFWVLRSPLNGVPGLIQLNAIRAALAWGAVVLTVVVVIVSSRRRGPRGARVRRTAVLGALGVGVGVLFGYGPVTQGVSAGSELSSSAELRVLSWNTGTDPTGAADPVLAQLVAEVNPNVIVLPEGPLGYVTYPWAETVGPNKVGFVGEGSLVGILMDADMVRDGAYRVDQTGVPPWAGLKLVSDDPASGWPTIIGAHIQQPGLSWAQTWREHLAWIADECAAGPVLVIGDFNSTVDNLGGPGIGSCFDVASVVGAGAVATWPAWAPPLLGVSIDRMMVSKDYPRDAAQFRVLRGAGHGNSDHWPIAGTLRL